MMKDRCHNPSSSGYENYGGRGIRVCSRWRKFENFIRDMGPRPSDAHSVERKDNDGNYSPDNCIWATRSQQNRNTRNCHKITWRGKSQTVAEWALELGVKAASISARIRNGWSEREALETSFEDPMQTRSMRRGDLMVTFRGETQTLAEWSRRTGIGRTTLRHRIAIGWSPEEALAAPVNKARSAGGRAAAESRK